MLWLSQSVASGGVIAQRPLNHGSNLIVVDGSSAASAGPLKQATEVSLQKSAAPFADGVSVDAEFARYRLVR
ncbi:hypothetical protein SAMN05216573_1416 [Bradyrhizobium sp. Rc3b]|nr:hypothetical protein SAMN05216573_1416 [Bradyrhizobium sp. Rc3b]